MEIATKVAPRGLPTWRRRAAGETCGEGEFDESGWREEFRRKSWVTAMPIEAKEREVRSQARKVRSVILVLVGVDIFHFLRGGIEWGM